MKRVKLMTYIIICRYTTIILVVMRFSLDNLSIYILTVSSALYHFNDFIYYNKLLSEDLG
jgi:hypothetical protein